MKNLILITFMIAVYLLIQPTTNFAQTVDERLKRVETAIDENDFDGAMNDLNEVFKVDTNNALAYEYRGLIRHKQKNYEQAIADYAVAIKLNPNAAIFYYNRALVHQFRPQPDYLSALADHSSALRLNPNYKDAYLYRCFTNSSLKNWAAAERDCSQAIKLGENGIEVYMFRGAANVNLKNYAQAATDNRKALEIDPNNAVAKKNLEISLAQQTSPPVKNEITPSPTKQTSPPIKSGLTYDQLIQRAQASIDSKNYDSAVADMTEAITLDSSPFLAYLTRGRAYYEQKKYDQAISDETAAIKTNSVNRNVAYYLRALANWANQPDDTQTVIADLTEALNLNPNYAFAHYERGHVYQQLKMWQQAEDDYRLVPSAARNTSFLIRHSEVLDKLNEIDEAIASAYAAVKLEPANQKAVQNHQTLLAKIPEIDRLLKVKKFYEDYQVLGEKYHLINKMPTYDGHVSCDKLYFWTSNFRKIEILVYLNIGLLVNEKDKNFMNEELRILKGVDDEVVAKRTEFKCSPNLYFHYPDNFPSN